MWTVAEAVDQLRLASTPDAIDDSHTGVDRNQARVTQVGVHHLNQFGSQLVM